MAYIYALVDERNKDNFRYIGMTTQPLTYRLRGHTRTRELNKGTHKANWINVVRSAGSEVAIVLLEECHESDMSDREIWHISNAKASGMRLTNATTGGEHYKHSDETRRKLSIMHTGVPMDARTKAKISEANKRAVAEGRICVPGHRHTEETKARMSEKRKGIPKSLEWRAMMSEIKTGRKRGAHECEALSRSQTGLHVGSLNRQATISEDQARHIYEQVINVGRTRASVAEEMCIGKSVVDRVASGKTWKHLNLVAA